MNFRKTILNLLILSLSVYTPLFLFSFVEFYNPRNTYRLQFNRRIKKDPPQIKKALNNGYLPNFRARLGSLMNISKNSDFDIYPIGSLPNTNTFYCNEGYGLIKYKTDRFGLRNVDNKWNKINVSNNIFVIGDSFVNGACVPNNNTIPDNIENLTKVNTLNLGSSRNDPYDYIAILNSIINPTLKKISGKNNFVILVFFQNDNIKSNLNKEKLLNKTKSIIENDKNNYIYPSKEYVNNLYQLVDKNLPFNKKELISEVERFNLKLTSYYYIATLFPIRKKIKLLKNRFVKENSVIQNFNSSPSAKSIDSLKKVCNKLCKPLIVYIPNSNFWQAGMFKEEYKKDLRNYSKRMKIKFIDSEEVFSKDDLKNFSPLGGHGSIEGYKKISALVSKEILKTLN